MLNKKFRVTVLELLNKYGYFEAWFKKKITKGKNEILGREYKVIGPALTLKYIKL